MKRHTKDQKHIHELLFIGFGIAVFLFIATIPQAYTAKTVTIASLIYFVINVSIDIYKRRVQLERVLEYGFIAIIVAVLGLSLL